MSRRIRVQLEVVSGSLLGMPVVLDLPDEVVARLRSEAEHRGVTFEQLITELAGALPTRNDDRSVPRLAFVASGASKSGITDKIDDLLADGFGRS